MGILFFDKVRGEPACLVEEPLNALNARQIFKPMVGISCLKRPNKSPFINKSENNNPNYFLPTNQSVNVTLTIFPSFSTVMIFFDSIV